MIATKLINTKNWAVYDGAGIETNCTKLTIYQFSYNVGGMILGAAAMYNMTESQTWKTRLDNLLEGSKVFFTGPNNDIMSEVACESVNTCNVDEHSFKAYLTRWLTMMTKWAPHTYDVIHPYLRASSVAAAKQCQGGANKRMCGLIWYDGKYDNTTGVGQQMAALEITMSNLILNSSSPVTADTGGTSVGDPGGGGDDIGRNQPKGPDYKPITGADKFGAAVLTLLAIATVVVAMGFIFLDETSPQGPVAQFKGFWSSASAAITTLAAGGGFAAAAAAGRRRSNKEKGIRINEKSILNNGESESSSKNPFSEPVMVTPDSVRHSVVSQRRLSNMPIGWPHNPSVRNSVVVAESSAAASSEDQRQR